MTATCTHKMALGEKCTQCNTEGMAREDQLFATPKMAIRFFVPGVAKGKGRARSRIAGAPGKQFVAHYTPKDTVAYEGLVSLAASKAMNGRAPSEMPVALQMQISVEPPASWSQKKRAKALAGQVMPTSKPDLDNCVKAVLDGCNKVVFRDDSVCCDLIVKKRYSETPGVEVWIGELGAEAAR
jgi:Holliday junction resolvase RusA-like endonuclease